MEAVIIGGDCDIGKVGGCPDPSDHCKTQDLFILKIWPAGGFLNLKGKEEII